MSRLRVAPLTGERRADFVDLSTGRGYMGHVGLFAAHGFEGVREAGKRAVVRRRL